MTKLPQARTSDIVFQEANSESLIYDLNIHKSYCLNETVSRVYRACDGKTPLADFAAEQQMPEEIVVLALEQLDKNGLLAEKFESTLPKDRVSRRKVLAMAGGMAVALPVISMLVAPTAAHAQSACILTNQQLCVADQSSLNNCIAAITQAATTRCCVGTVTVISFGTIQNPNSCCGTCGPPIG